MMQFLQFLVLAFTVIAWWLAKRDLNARAAHSSVREELEQMRATVEALTANLEQRAEAAEQRLAERIAEARAQWEGPCPTSSREPGLPPEGEDARSAPVFALAAAGVTDPIEIARRTGLGRGEVELILGLRARRVL